MEEFFIGLGAVVVVFLAIILIRTFTFKPKKSVELDDSEVVFDKDEVISNLQELVRFKTISYKNSELEDEKEFEGFINKLPALYPNVFKICEFKRFEDRGILIKWKGKTDKNPAVMMAHYDVVPVNEDAWTVAPFEGVIKNETMYGRGVADTKVTLNGSLTACENLIKSGFVPERDVYFAYSGNEEINGKGGTVGSMAFTREEAEQRLKELQNG